MTAMGPAIYKDLSVTNNKLLVGYGAHASVLTFVYSVYEEAVIQR